MKAVILAGGYGTRLSEETTTTPKPMVEIGGNPILWHIMKIYSAHGINDFIICLGYKGYIIKEYFANYFLHTSDVTFDMKMNVMKTHTSHAEPWTVTLVDTGENTMTGGRLKRVQKYVGDEDFCFTYGDGIGDVDITQLIKQHAADDDAIATVTGVRQPSRFGVFNLAGNKVSHFQEKPEGAGGWINGGYFVLSSSVFDYLDNDETVWETEPMQKIAANNLMSVYLHEGFWHPMDTLRDKHLLENLWNTQQAKWKIWN